MLPKRWNVGKYVAVYLVYRQEPHQAQPSLTCLLQAVPKPGSLPVRDIFIILTPQLNIIHSIRVASIVNKLPATDGPSRARTALETFLPHPPRVSPSEVRPQSQRQQYRQGVADHDSPKGSVVCGCLRALEELRASNVTGTVGKENQRRHGHLLGHAAVVCLDKRQRERHGRGPRGEQEVAEQLDAAGHVLARVDEGGAGDTGQHDAGDEDAIGLAEAASQPAGEHDAAARDERVRDIDQGALQAREAEGLDDQVGEVLGAAVGDLGQDLEPEDEPCLGVDKALAHLRPVPGRLLRAPRPRDDDPVRGELLLLRGEEVGGRYAVGKGEPEDERPEESRYSQNDEHPPPGTDRVVDVSHAEGEERSDHAADGIAREPDAGAKGNLIARVPRRGDEHKGRCDSSLSNTEQEADGEQAAIVGACRSHADDDPPEQCVGGHVPCNRETGDEESGRIRPGEVTKVEDR